MPPGSGGKVDPVVKIVVIEMSPFHDPEGKLIWLKEVFPVLAPFWYRFGIAVDWQNLVEQFRQCVVCALGPMLF